MNAPAVTVPEALTAPAAAARRIIGATGIVAAVVVAVGSRSRAADNRTGGESADHAGSYGTTMATRFCGRRRCNRCHRQGRGRCKGSQGLCHGFTFCKVGMTIKRTLPLRRSIEIHDKFLKIFLKI